MTGALRYEWVRIRTIGSTYWFYGIAVGITVLITGLVIWGVNSSLPEDFNVEEATTWVVTGLGSGSFVPVLAAPFCAAVGVLAMGHEYRYGTNKATLTAIPDRSAVLTAKPTSAVAASAPRCWFIHDWMLKSLARLSNRPWAP